MKREMVNEDRGEAPVSRACELLEVTRSGYYRSLAPQLDRDAALRGRVLELTEAFPEYGYRRIVLELLEQGIRANAKRVRRVMSDCGRLCTVRRGHRHPQTTDSRHGLGVYPDLTRDLELRGPDQLWVSDISYLRLARGGFVYLATVMDAWSRRIVGWEVLDSIDTRLPLSALHKALDTRQVQPGWVHHSDRGSQYASNAYGDAVTAAGGRRSMSRKGHPGDNSKAESFFATLKCEHVYRTEYEDLADAREQVAAFMERYNRIRRHSALGYVSPERFEAAGAGAGHTGGEDRRRSRSESASLAHRGQPHRDHRREARSPDEPHHQLGQACTSSSGRHPTK